MVDAQTVDALVIGAGPAGLMAAEALARAGRRVVICDGKPSPARKFLMAGKSGLNITKSQDYPDFLATYPEWLRPIVAEFGPDEVVAWCRDLGQEVFVGSTGRVFPEAMKASPLLRAWLGRLGGMGAELRSRWRWTGFEEGAGIGFAFDTPGGAQVLRPAVTVLALGGASWSRLGSDGAWVPWLQARGVEVAPWRPANMGFGVAWSAHMAKHFGTPVKGVALLVAKRRERGEFVVTATGIEGGGIYALSRDLRAGGKLRLDLMPDVAADEVTARLGRMKVSETRANRLRKLGLPAVSVALMQEFDRTANTDLALSAAIKSLPVPLLGPAPIDGAISVAGGITAAALTADLQLRALPGVYAAGEMLDWEAPTGGYLLTGCLATGLRAGQGAGG